MNNKDSLPPSSEIAREMIVLLGDKPRGLKCKEVYSALSKIFKLNQEQLKLQVNCDTRSRWENWCQGTRDMLVKQGIIDKNSPRGVWRLTEKGQKKSREYSPS